MKVDGGRGFPGLERGGRLASNKPLGWIPPGGGYRNPEVKTHESLNSKRVLHMADIRMHPKLILVMENGGNSPFWDCVWVKKLVPSPLLPPPSILDPMNP